MAETLTTLHWAPRRALVASRAVEKGLNIAQNPGNSWLPGPAGPPTACALRPVFPVVG